MVRAEDLIKNQQERIENKKKIYKKIYKRIEKKIKMCSSFNLYKCWYEIPEFILNIPLYSTNDCMEYLNEKFKKNGFKTESQNNLIIVSWEI